MPMPRDPSVLGGELLAKWTYIATRNASPNDSGPPWELLSDSTKDILTRAANEVIGQMAAAGFLSDGTLRKTEVPTNIVRLSRKQIGNR